MLNSRTIFSSKSTKSWQNMKIRELKQPTFLTTRTPPGSQSSCLVAITIPFTTGWRSCKNVACLSSLFAANDIRGAVLIYSDSFPGGAFVLVICTTEIVHCAISKTVLLLVNHNRELFLVYCCSVN